MRVDCGAVGDEETHDGFVVCADGLVEDCCAGEGAGGEGGAVGDEELDERFEGLFWGWPGGDDDVEGGAVEGGGGGGVDVEGGEFGEEGDEGLGAGFGGVEECGAVVDGLGGEGVEVGGEDGLEAVGAAGEGEEVPRRGDEGSDEGEELGGEGGEVGVRGWRMGEMEEGAEGAEMTAGRHRGGGGCHGGDVEVLVFPRSRWDVGVGWLEPRVVLEPMRGDCNREA